MSFRRTVLSMVISWKLQTPPNTLAWSCTISLAARSTPTAQPAKQMPHVHSHKETCEDAHYRLGPIATPHSLGLSWSTPGLFGTITPRKTLTALRRPNVALLDLSTKTSRKSYLTHVISATRGTLKFFIQYSRITTMQYSFFPDTARLWISLPPDVAAAQLLESFKTRLHGSLLRWVS